jgi:hypothetical protein
MESFREWTTRHRTVVHPVRWRSVRELSLILEPFIETYPPRPHRCYDNAAELAHYAPEIEYVVGWVVFKNDIIEHAWNKLGDIHFDITWEDAWNGQVAFDHHIAVATLPVERLRKIAGPWSTPTLFDIYMAAVNPQFDRLFQEAPRASELR